MQAAAAVSILEICDKLQPETFLPYLDPVVHGLLGLLDPAGTPAMEHLYVQVQVVATMRFVADAGQHTFAKVPVVLSPSHSFQNIQYFKHYPVVMPWLLDVLRSLDGVVFKKLRARAMECAGCVGQFPFTCFLFTSHSLTAAAVGVDVFRPDAHALVELLILIGSSFIYLATCH